ncbi:MAG TPA: DUF998 domain-containing protein [Candidatus Lokiarchaeia archaeon]|nr:DUF998 domain-containing protein [Candidatus Lokiarchaeia archaeon]
MDIRTWLHGKATKINYVKMLILAIGILILGIIFAGAFYQLPFSFLTTQISDLGMRPTNPVGSWIFTVAFIFAGIIIAPHAFYFYEILQPDAKRVSKLSAACIFVAGIGLAGVGIFQAGLFDPVHDTVSVMAFGGIGLSCFLSIVPIRKKMKQNAPWPKLWQVILFYGQFIVVIIITAIVVTTASTNIFDPTYAFYPGVPIDYSYYPLGWPPCEWSLLFSAIFWAFGLILMSPNKKINEK